MDISRRRFVLAAAGFAGLSATSGCMDVLSDTEPAFLSYKGISVQWAADHGQGYVADLCWLWSNGQDRVFGWAPEEYPDIVQSPTAVTVSSTTLRRLRDRFVDVELVVGFSSIDTTTLSLLESDLGRVAVSRDRFNRVQFGDRIEVATDDSDVSIRDIQPGGHADPTDWTVTLGTKNLVTQFPDKQVPEP